MVSIIIPCYNQERFLDEALQSVLDQTYCNWECIIVNDGSTDGTGHIAQKWCNKDKRFAFYSKENGGISSARNYGINRARGEFIQFLDADDVLAPGKLEVSLSGLCGSDNLFKKRIIVTNFQMTNAEGTEIYDPYCNLKSSSFALKNILYQWDVDFSIPIHCGLFSIDLFQEFRFPEKINAYEDWIMWLYFFRDGSNVIFLDETLVYYRIHPNNASINSKLLKKNHIKAVIHLSNILSPEEVLPFYQFLLQNNEKKIRELSVVIRNFEGSRTFRIYRRIREFKILERILNLFS